MKQKLMDPKEKMSFSTITDEDFKTHFSVIDRTNTQNISKDIRDLNNTINQLDLVDIYRTSYQMKAECIFLFWFGFCFGFFQNVYSLKQT